MINKKWDLDLGFTTQIIILLTEMMKINNMNFIKFFIVWMGSNLAVPFWVVGHVHLTMNVYEDLHEIIASFGMNILVLMAFWLEWKKHKKEEN